MLWVINYTFAFEHLSFTLIDVLACNDVLIVVSRMSFHSNFLTDDFYYGFHLWLLRLRISANYVILREYCYCILCHYQRWYWMNLLCSLWPKLRQATLNVINSRGEMVTAIKLFTRNFVIIQQYYTWEHDVDFCFWEQAFARWNSASIASYTF